MNSSIRRDLPSPGSPTIINSWPSPCRARSQRRIRIAVSSSRPTSGVKLRCPERRPPRLARTNLKSVTGSGTPFSVWLPRSSATNRPATWRCTRAVTRTAPGSASACTRAATLGASPKISPEASTTTGPVSRPMRALSTGLPEPAFLRFNSASARCIASAARTARSESFSCGVVERFFAWIGRNRRLAKDFEATIESARAFLYAASVLVRRIARAS
jgi:hypothetical protein